MAKRVTNSIAVIKQGQELWFDIEAKCPLRVVIAHKRASVTWARMLLVLPIICLRKRYPCVAPSVESTATQPIPLGLGILWAMCCHGAICVALDELQPSADLSARGAGTIG